MMNWEEGIAPEVELFAEALLDSATVDVPDEAAFGRTARRLGLTSLLASGVLLGASGARAASSGMFAKVSATGAVASQGTVAATGSGLVLVKWAGAGLLLGMTSVGVTQAVFHAPASGVSVASRVVLPAPSAVAIPVRPQLKVPTAIAAPASVAKAQDELQVESPAVNAAAIRTLQGETSAAVSPKEHVDDVVAASVASVESVGGPRRRELASVRGPSAQASQATASFPVARAVFAVPSARSADGLASEVRLVDALRAAVARQDNGSLQTLLAQYGREHPSGELRAEVAAIRARGLSSTR